MNQLEPKRSSLCSAHVSPACLYIFQCIEALLPAKTIATEARGVRGCGSVAPTIGRFMNMFDMQSAESSSTFLVQPDLCGGCWGALKLYAICIHMPSHWHCKTALALASSLFVIHFKLRATTLKALHPCRLANGQSAKFFIAFKPKMPKEKEQLKMGYQELQFAHRAALSVSRRTSCVFFLMDIRT